MTRSDADAAIIDTDAQHESGAIREAVRHLLRAAAVTEPPVDLTRVATVQGIGTIKTSGRMRRTLGTLRDGSHGMTVTLNGREPFRARFTLAHEIGHTMVDMTGRSPRQIAIAMRRPRGKTAVERLCDQIAAELLMPYDMFGAALREPSIGEAMRLARLFDTSLQSAALRLGELSEEPVQVLCWSRHGANGLRVRWQTGRPFLAGRDKTEHRALSSNTSAIMRACASRERETGVEVPHPDRPWARYRCEAQGFLRGDARFVLSVIKPIPPN